MATSVQILCPNGRRQNVKVTPNTKLMQVLEEVCTKQAFLPPDDYDLIHGRKPIDLTLAFRFSNLPNNAKLELVKSATPRSHTQGEVTIALQLESGERLQHAFQPSTSLWEILEYWEAQDGSYKGRLTFVDASQTPPLHPVCIYMREEVVGEPGLKDVTLKKLALTSGKAIIRLVHRPVEDSTLAEVMGKIEQERVKRAKLAQKAQKAESAGTASLASLSSSQASSSVDVTANTSGAAVAKQETSAEDKMEAEEPVKEIGVRTSQEDGEKQSTGTEVEPMDTQDVQAPASQPSGSAGGKDGTVSENVLTSNVDRPAAEDGATGVSPIEHLRRMNIPGVEIITPNDFNDLPPEQQQIARLLAERLLPGVLGSQQKGTGATKASKPKPKSVTPRQPFAEFKFPDATKGQELYRNELSEVKREEFKPCDRETVVYDSNEDNASKAVAEDLPDEFFEVTDADVKSLYKNLQRQVSGERALMTESMRQAELEERHRQYDHVVLRIQFPDGLVLQGCFRPRETVYALQKFVKDHLEDKEQEFYLYRTPPKQIFSDMTKTLVQADLAPASLIYFHSDKKEDHSITASAMTEVAPKRRADELSVKILAKKQMESLASGNGSAGTSSGSTGGSKVATDRSSNPAPKAASASAAGGEPKMPKWLKMGKK